MGISGRPALFAVSRKCIGTSARTLPEPGGEEGRSGFPGDFASGGGALSNPSRTADADNEDASPLRKRSGCRLFEAALRGVGHRHGRPRGGGPFRAGESSSWIAGIE